MTDYSFRTEIIWPDDLPNVPPEVIAAMAKRIDEELFRTIVGPVRAPSTYPVAPVPRCCYGTVLHAPNCKYWCMVT